MASRGGIWGVTTLVLVAVAFGGGVYLAPHLKPGGLAKRIEAGEPFNGELSSRSAVNLKDGSRYEYARVAMPESGVVVFELDAPFTGSISVLGEDNALLAESHGEPGSSGPGTRVAYRSSSAETVSLVVSGSDSRAFGPFTVNAERIDLGTPQTLDGVGEATGWFDGRESIHSLEVGEEALYIIDVGSDSFDTTLELTGNRVSLRDDDGGDGTNSRIEALLPPGTYQLRVQAFGGDGSAGLYSLAVTSRPPPDMTGMTNEGELEPGEPVNGWLQGTAPNQYSFTVALPGRFEFDLRSDEFDTVLEVEGVSLALEDDDGGDGSNSRLEAELPAGRYQVRVRGFGSEDSGRYTLQVSPSP